MRFYSPLITAIILAGSVAAANADTFKFAYTQGDPDGIYFAASGTLTADPTGTPNEFTITGVTGTETFGSLGSSSTETITGLLMPDTAYNADDILNTSGVVPYLDGSGFTYTTTGNGSDHNGDANIYYLSSQSVYSTPYEGLSQNGAFTLTDVPEPASLTMVLGFLGLGLALRKAYGRQ